jgi:hypothetical protein
MPLIELKNVWGQVMSLHRIRKHPEFVEGCFGCKASTVDLNAGEASTRLTMSAKKWDNELALYRSARAQGIQPDSTKTKDIRKAIDISNKTGRAYGNG